MHMCKNEQLRCRQLITELAAQMWDRRIPRENTLRSMSAYRKQHEKINQSAEARPHTNRTTCKSTDVVLPNIYIIQNPGRIHLRRTKLIWGEKRNNVGRQEANQCNGRGWEITPGGETNQIIVKSESIQGSTPDKFDVGVGKERISPPTNMAFKTIDSLLLTCTTIHDVPNSNFSRNRFLSFRRCGRTV